MPESTPISSSTPGGVQLTQVKVPLDVAAEAFAARDAHGKIPLVVIPERLNRIQLWLLALAAAGLTGGAALWAVRQNGLWLALGILLAVLLALLSIYRAFIVRVPEGVTALLSVGGRFTRTLDSGTHLAPPWVIVTHLVTRREIPFDVPVVHAPTRDNVRASVDALVTFTISDPYRFVYNISAVDFDQVFQALCQDGLRTLIRQVSAEQISSIKRRSLSELIAVLSNEVDGYGVKLTRITITYAQPPDEFMAAQEARQLSVFLQAEQMEAQELAMQKQHDTAVLLQADQEARLERETRLLELQVRQAEIRRKMVELDAQSETYRLAKLQDRLKKFPLAAQHELETAELGVSRALAGNTRAVLQLGNAGDIARAFLVRDLLDAPAVALPASGTNGNRAGGSSTEGDPP